MNKGSILVCINSINDVDKITPDTKYINIAIDNINTDVIDYFLLHGDKYSYSDIMNGKMGFIYADYECFRLGEMKISNIINNMPNNLNTLEKIRYIYISLGNLLSSDINLMEDKNECVSFANISLVNNIWGSLANGKTFDKTISKIFMYVCARIGIKSELIVSNIGGSIGNKIYLNDSFLIVNLFKDISNIRGKFITRYFDKYNDDINMDKKIHYINDNYTDYYLNDILKKIDCTKDNFLYEVVSVMAKLINIGNIDTFSLSEIYINIFKEYFPNVEIGVNNFYICSGSEKETFVIIRYKDEMYSFNYQRNKFIQIDPIELENNINSNRIGIYLDEAFDFNEKGVVL